MRFVEAAAITETDDCILWPYGTSCGYGMVNRKHASAVVCELVHGPRPDRHDCAHSCGVRTCVNPRHLRWATRTENNHDIALHGRKPRRLPGQRGGWASTQ